MQRVMLLEPDAALREWCRLHLEAQKLVVLGFDDAGAALQALRLDPPDLVLVATDMPAGGAFALVAALRSSLRTALIPVLFLVPSQDAQAQAFALSIEPDSMVTKPCSREILLRAVHARLNSANEINAGRERNLLSSLGGAREGLDVRRGLVVDTRQVTVLVIVLRNFVSLARAMSARPLDTLLRRFMASAGETVTEQQGWIAYADATKLVVLFEDGPEGGRPHATRAVETALRVLLAARQAKQAKRSTSQGAPFPDLSIGCGVHSGEVLIARLPGGGHVSLTLAGQTVDLAQRLDGRAKGLGWSVAASEATVAAAGARFQLGRSATLTDGDHGVTLSISEVVGFNPGFARPGELPVMAEVREAVLANTMLAELAGDIDQHSADRTIMVRAKQPPAPDPLPELPDRRLTRRIGRGQRVRTYLAIHVPTGREEVVTLVRSSESTAKLVAAYLQAYRRIATLEQRNIVSVYEVGDLADGGYVAAEFLPGGSLLEAIRARLPIGRALRSVAEMCLALDAVHGIGLSHGALGANHFMFRDSGVLALMDFNLAERLTDPVAPAGPVALGAKGDLQAAAGDPTADARADFRAVGCILHAMLTGDLGLAQTRPDQGSADLYQATRLPLSLSALQPCLDGLLGVGTSGPTQRAEDVLVELLALKDVFPFDIQESLPSRAGSAPASRRRARH